MHAPTVPFTERGGVLRGCLDLVCGRFPAFVFGGPVGRLLPVFHFHECTRAELEPRFRHLAENGYKTLRSDEILAYVTRKGQIPARAVALCFDDAWADLYTVAAPLLREYGLTAITYAIPARMSDDENTSSKFVSWSQLRELHTSGVVEVQSHTYSHSMVHHATEPCGFVTPAYSGTPFLNRPQLVAPPELRFLRAEELGAPLYPARSRMSDARRVTIGLAGHDRAVAFVAREGGAAFFERPDWEPRLRAELGQTVSSRVESEAEHAQALERELADARDVLNARLGTTTVNHICLPWGVIGEVGAQTLARVGYKSAFANRLRGTHAVCPGDDPYWLKRLPNKYIERLPGLGRRYVFSGATAS